MFYISSIYFLLIILYGTEWAVPYDFLVEVKLMY